MVLIQGLADGLGENGGDDDGHGHVEDGGGNLGTGGDDSGGGGDTVDDHGSQEGLEQVKDGVGQGTGAGGQQVLQIGLQGQVMPGQTGGQRVGTLHQKGQPGLGDVGGVGHVVNGRAKACGQTAQAGAQQDAAEGAEDVAQMEGGGAADGDGTIDYCLYTTKAPSTKATVVAKIGEGIFLSENDKGYMVPHHNIVFDFDDERDYLYPIPIDDLSLNPALTQNPGWTGIEKK